jgi:hypothetical protein
MNQIQDILRTMEYGPALEEDAHVRAWLILMKEELGRDWLEPELFRLGASSLLGDIERQIEHFVTGRYSSSDRHGIA